MLGSSSNLLDGCIRQIIHLLAPTTLLELGCGSGKFGHMLQSHGYSADLTAVLKMFSAEDETSLKGRGYSRILDRDIMEYYREGFDEHYDVILALDVIEHFLYSDAISIINFSLYRCDYMMLVWPSQHPQTATSNSFDRHRSSFGIRELSQNFDVVFYAQTGFAQVHSVHQYNVVLLRGFMNLRVFPPLIPS